mmetsp:Transcript_33207/g.93080  ORF Transcript_33207/g.93080 Transcript_33207/m.93080 type:complete len:206 (-) Transcript_33207:1079-1696(-)
MTGVIRGCCRQSRRGRRRPSRCALTYSSTPGRRWRSTSRNSSTTPLCSSATTSSWESSSKMFCVAQRGTLGTSTDSPPRFHWCYRGPTRSRGGRSTSRSSCRSSTHRTALMSAGSGPVWRCSGASFRTTRACAWTLSICSPSSPRTSQSRCCGWPPCPCSGQCTRPTPLGVRWEATCWSPLSPAGVTSWMDRACSTWCARRGHSF